MLCPVCYGRPTPTPCETCNGSGFTYCCEGEQCNIETEVTNCPYCNKSVISLWVSGGGGCLSRPEYVLIADWIYHTVCWNELVEKFPT
jgi:hypothetical protein